MNPQEKVESCPAPFGTVELGVGTDRLINRKVEKYTPEIIGNGKVSVKEITLKTGAIIQVAKITEAHPKIAGDYIHKIYSNGCNGQNTLLEFSLSKEACMAIVELYVSHGMFIE